MAAVTLCEKMGFKSNQNSENDNMELNLENLAIKVLLARLLDRKREREREMI
jgi:hypothetical protein